MIIVEGAFMNFIEFDNVSFTYPKEDDYTPQAVFKDFSVKIAPGFISITGPNGVGKSTLLMLAAGRLIANSGTVTLFGKDTSKFTEDERGLLAQVIYQNMEFESEDTIGNLLNYVYNTGAYEGNAKLAMGELLELCTKEFEIENLLKKTLSKISKGELQRVLLAFCILYGTPAVFMDEPFFAMENRHTIRALTFLKRYALESGTAFVLCMHDLDMTKRFCDTAMLLFPNQKLLVGPPEKVLTKEALEEAYNVPESLLRQKEILDRKQLENIANLLRDKSPS